MKCFIKGETDVEHINMYMIDSDTQERSIDVIPFNDYLYISLDDFNVNKELIKKRFGAYIGKVVLYHSQNKDFAKIILKDNTKKNFIKDYLDEQDIKHYEADLSATKRYLIDNHDVLKLNQTGLPYIFYDLETDDTKDFKYDKYDKIVPENVILSFAATDYKGNQFFIINEDVNNPECEQKLLLKIDEIFQKYGVICGYNNFGFDDIYIEGRCKIHNLPNIIKHHCKIDYLFSYKRYTPQDTLESYSLENVSQTELGEGKTEDVKGGSGRIRKLYLEKPDKLREYNIQDTTLLYKLNNKLRFLELHLFGAEDACCSVDETMYNAGTNDYYILGLCKEDGIVANSTPTSEEIERRKRLNNMIGGGYTRGHNRGFFKNAWVEDFESLYPSVEITCNISAESFVMNATTEIEKQYLEWMHKDIKVFKNKNDLIQYAKQHNYTITYSDRTYVAKRGTHLYHPYRFYKGDKIAILPKLMLKLISERRILKKQMKELDKQLEQGYDKQIQFERDRMYLSQLNKKYALVSNYGLNGSIYYRFFNYDVIDSITATGRGLIKRVNRLATDVCKLIKIYNDTDSVGLARTDDSLTPDQFDELLVKFLDDEAEFFNNNIFKRKDKYGTHKHHLGMEHEKDYDTLLYVKKKRYAYAVQGKISIVGLESTQMNVLADELQRELLNDILLERFDKDKWKIKLEQLYNDCFSMKIPADKLIIYKKYSKSLDGYEGEVIDSKTNNAKIKKDGTVQKKSIPAHIILAQRLIAEGKELYVGDKIEYIIQTTSPRQYVITKEEFEKQPMYDKEHYWELFTTPLITILGTYDKNLLFEVIKLPEREKILDKINKENSQQTLFGDSPKLKLLKERLERFDSSLLGDEIDPQELVDYIL